MTERSEALGRVATEPQLGRVATEQQLGRVATEKQVSKVTAEPLAGKRLLSGAELKTLATAGGFAVDETTGNRMIQALEDMIDALETRWATLQRLGSSPPLSSTSTAQWAARHTVNTASDDRGLLTQLRQARAELPQYVEAIREAKRAYQNTETSSVSELQRLKPSGEL